MSKLFLSLDIEHVFDIILYQNTGAEVSRGAAGGEKDDDSWRDAYAGRVQIPRRISPRKAPPSEVRCILEEASPHDAAALGEDLCPF